MKSNRRVSKLIKRLGITFVIPFFMLIFGVIILLSVGWRLLSDTIGVAAVLFNKPDIAISEKVYLINNRIMSRPSIGEGFGTLEIPDLNLKETIYHGDSDRELKNGVGHFTGSTLPGENGNVIISAHKHTYFKAIENIKVGAEVIITTDYGTFEYRVSEIKIVDKNDNQELRVLNYERLTMYTCYPFTVLNNDGDRMIVICDLVKSL